jgi:hypothetical protein
MKKVEYMPNKITKNIVKHVKNINVHTIEYYYKYLYFFLYKNINGFLRML